MKALRWTALMLLISPVLGCNNSPSDLAADPAMSVDATAAMRVDIKSWDEVQQWVDSQRGKVVVIDVWSNW